MTLVSIVIPAHNTEGFLGVTLDGMLAQTHEDWECIVVDDSSEDATLEVAELYAHKDERIRAIHVEHGGVSKARNAGFRQTSELAAYCTFMDSDDVWTPKALESLVDTARSAPSAIGSHGVAEFIDESGAPTDPGWYADKCLKRIGLVGKSLQGIPPTTPTDFSALLAGGSIFPPGLLLVERQAYVRAGPFDESLVVGEDFEMVSRIVREGQLAFLPEVVLFYRRHEDNRSAKPDAAELVHHAYCQIFHSPLNSMHQRVMARRVWRALQRERLSGDWAEAWSLGLRAPKETASYLARSALAAWRFIRGYPKPVVRRSRQYW
jgi:glycosyltransferase involved in cell wall biosynthesis